MALGVEDRLAIMETLSRYNHAIDNFLPDAANAWAQCFTEDGTFTAVSSSRSARSLPHGMSQAAKPDYSGPGDEDALISLRGREQLLAFAASAHASHVHRRQPGYHWVSNILIDGEGECATMSCYLRVMAGKTQESGEFASVTGIYRDRLRRLDGYWKFESRIVTFDD